MGDVAKADVLNTVFGLEAVNAASILMGSAGSGALQDYIDTLNDAGSAARVAAEINDNTAGSLLRLGSAATEISIALGTTLIPMVTDLAEQLIPVLTYVSDWAAANPALVKSIGEWAGKLFLASGALLAMKWAFSPVLAAVRAGIWVWGASAVGLGLLGTAVSGLAVGLGGLATLATAHPIIAMVTALAAGALAIYKNWDGIVGYLENVVERIKNAFASLVFLDGPVRNFDPSDPYHNPKPRQGSRPGFRPDDRYLNPAQTRLGQRCARRVRL